MAHAAEMPVPSGAFLRAVGLRVMGRADRTVHVRCDPFGRRRGVSPINPPINPLTGYVRRRTAIVGGLRHPGLEPPHPAGRLSLGINATPSDHLPHQRIERQPPPTVETEPDITRFACTLRVIRTLQPTQHAEI